MLASEFLGGAEELSAPRVEGSGVCAVCFWHSESCASAVGSTTLCDVCWLVFSAVCVSGIITLGVALGFADFWLFFFEFGDDGDLRNSLSLTGVAATGSTSQFSSMSAPVTAEPRLADASR